MNNPHRCSQVTRHLLLCCAFVTMTATVAFAQPQARKGYPSRTGEINIREHFAHPPKGYGNVPFCWWTGDSLNMER